LSEEIFDVRQSQTLTLNSCSSFLDALHMSSETHTKEQAKSKSVYMHERFLVIISGVFAEDNEKEKTEKKG